MDTGSWILIVMIVIGSIAAAYDVWKFNDTMHNVAHKDQVDNTL